MDDTEPTTQQTGNPIAPTDGGYGPFPIEKGRRLTGQSLAKFSEWVVAEYKITTIRGICDKTGRSYGAIHRILVNSGVTRRTKGARPPTTSTT
jgi:hypothetical protein